MTTASQMPMGWVPPELRDSDTNKIVESVVGGMPPFLIVGSAGGEDNRGKRVVLWDYAKKVNGGKHLPTFRQEVGDCVSQGAANAVNYLACMEIIRLGEREEYRPAFQPYIYGISRVQIGGGRIGGDGSIGAWAAEGVRKFGVLFTTDNQVPAYSGAVARKWGNRPGPPQSMIEQAKDNLVRSTAQVRSYEEVRDAICNGYPVTVASNRGFQMRPKVDGGKHWGVASGSWAHQMCFIGVDDGGGRPGCYCLNSWGADAHGPPADDAPPGGFWVDADVVTSMVRQDDSFAFSQFDGFPAQKLDFTVIG